MHREFFNQISTVIVNGTKLVELCGEFSLSNSSELSMICNLSVLPISSDNSQMFGLISENGVRMNMISSIRLCYTCMAVYLVQCSKKTLAR